MYHPQSNFFVEIGGFESPSELSGTGNSSRKAMSAACTDISYTIDAKCHAHPQNGLVS